MLAFALEIISSHQPERDAVREHGGQQRQYEGESDSVVLDGSGDGQQEDRGGEGADHHAAQRLASSLRALEAVGEGSQDAGEHGEGREQAA